MPCSEKEKLLDDLLRDANYEAFRAEVYELSAAEFQAKRRPRTLIYLGLAASIAAVGALVVINVSVKKPASTAVPAAVAFQEDRGTVISRIQTSRLEIIEIVRSVADRNLIVSTPNHGRTGVKIVGSDPATVDRVNDAELLALFPDETVGFVTTEKGKKLIVFADGGTEFELPFAKRTIP